MFFAIAIVLAVLVSAAVAFALGPGKRIHTSAWTSATGLTDLGQTVLHIYLASIGYAVLGTALAVLLRSPALAVAVGVAYPLPPKRSSTGSGTTATDGYQASSSTPSHTAARAPSATRTRSSPHRLRTILATGTLILFKRQDV